FTMPLSAWPSGLSAFRISGALLGTTIRFVIPTDDVDGPWVYEYLEPGSRNLFGMAGAAVGTVANGAIGGTLDGSLEADALGMPWVTCKADDHRFVLQR